MAKYLKDKKIIIYKKIAYESEHGFPEEGYMPISKDKLWAYFKQLSATLTYLNNSTQNNEECLFRVNWSDYIRKSNPAELAIGYNGIIYNVTRIDPYEDYKRDLVLYAKNNYDKLENIIPYDPEKL